MITERPNIGSVADKSKQVGQSHLGLLRHVHGCENDSKSVDIIAT
jgi:hypothetical protein